jgi:hypothetical protein
MHLVHPLLCHPGQPACAVAHDDLIRGPCERAATLKDRMGPGFAPLRGLAGMTGWSVAL